MKSLNKVQLIGWLGRDMEIKTARNGSVYANIRMATDQFFRQPNGETIKNTSWHSVRIWGESRVEKYRNYLIKGSHVLVEGSILYRTYTDNNGARKNVSEIKASLLVDLDR